MPHDVAVRFLAVILGKKSSSLCLVITNPSGTCTDAERSWPSPAVLCAAATVLFRALKTLPNHSFKVFLRAEGYFTFLFRKEVLFCWY